MRDPSPIDDAGQLQLPMHLLPHAPLLVGTTPPTPWICGLLPGKRGPVFSRVLVSCCTDPHKSLAGASSRLHRQACTTMPELRHAAGGSFKRLACLRASQTGPNLSDLACRCEILPQKPPRLPLPPSRPQSLHFRSSYVLGAAPLAYKHAQSVSQSTRRCERGRSSEGAQQR